MTDDRLIDVYDVNTGKLVEQISQWEALKRILVHCFEAPTVKRMENQRWRVDDLLKGSTARYANRLYCCTQPEPERLPEPSSSIFATICNRCGGSGVEECSGVGGFFLGVCTICDGAGNLD